MPPCLRVPLVLALAFLLAASGVRPAPLSPAAPARD